MKLRLDIDQDSYTLDVTPTGDNAYRYAIDGAESRSGAASVVEVMPGVYSILDGARSWIVTVAGGANGIEAWVQGNRYILSVSDPRDRPSRSGTAGKSGPLEVRSLMPGKVIRVLVARNDHVSAGQGLVVVEAMKMQNELKAPRDGRVTTITAVEGATVGAGVTLVVLE